MLPKTTETIIFLGHEIYKSEIECARQHTNLFFCWWLSCIFFAVTQWCAAPFLSGTYKSYLINGTFTDRELPYMGWFPLNTRDIYAYIFLLMLQIIGMLSCTFGIIFFDSLYISILIIIRVQFRYINMTLVATSNLAEEQRAPDALISFKTKLKNCVDCHVEIIKFLKMLQAFASPMMFAQCIECVLELCFTSFQASAIELTMDKKNMIALFKLCGYFSTAAVQLYFFCFFATQIESLASQIPHSVYSCGWEMMIFKQRKEPSTKKQFNNDINQLVNMITIQAQRPIVLTGGPFYVLSMETFRAMMSLALSNSIMLRQLSDRDK
ncbi:odorant receptor 4-like [Harpegnathos saltator]|uniref:odorant receptor 4-like n=1 Tax=Harpegnathos saltator TaxID=610380 RepID=UPI000DBEDE2F|nr:odorant receptor 4-like [Harpegnathos saltator]